MRKVILICFIILVQLAYTQDKKSDRVNVFLGTSGDYGQLSPGASYPFSMLCISPQSYPFTHTGYEYKAKEFKGVTHTMLQGVGCKGSGGNILIKPIVGSNIDTELIKEKEKGSPGYYHIELANKIQADYTVLHNFGIHQYHFVEKPQVYLDLSKATQNAFVQADFQIRGQVIQGKISSKTTCMAGVYHFYFYIDFGKGSHIEQVGKYDFIVDFVTKTPEVRIGFSSVSESYAKQRTQNNLSFDEVKHQADTKWNELLSRVDISDPDQERVNLFYSLLYRTLQAPFVISEEDGSYRAINGQQKKATFKVYHGWALWDNYREIIPLYSILYPEVYPDVVQSIANLYPHGKKNFATIYEPAPTVRTEHAIVVLADAMNKGIKLPINSIKQDLISEAEHLDFSTPDKALESSYDLWALSEVLKRSGDTERAMYYKQKASEYKSYWVKDFKDITAKDVDVMQARGLYQGTIWQYRWFVPFDIKGLIELNGSLQDFENQLDLFFNQHYYNHANQPDLQTSNLYNATANPYKSQALIHKLLIGESIQYYFNDNSRGIDPYIGRIYKNEPQAFLRTMDDDLGTMSAWFVLRSMGLSAVNVGSDKFYWNAPLFSQLSIRKENNTFLKITNANRLTYIDDVQIGGKEYEKNYISYKKLLQSSQITFKTNNNPNKQWPKEPVWISNIEENE